MRWDGSSKHRLVAGGSKPAQPSPTGRQRSMDFFRLTDEAYGATRIGCARSVRRSPADKRPVWIVVRTVRMRTSSEPLRFRWPSTESRVVKRQQAQTVTAVPFTQPDRDGRAVTLLWVRCSSRRWVRSAKCTTRNSPDEGAQPGVKATMISRRPRGTFFHEGSKRYVLFRWKTSEFLKAHRGILAAVDLSKSRFGRSPIDLT